MVLRMMTKRKNKNYCSKFCAGLSALLLSAFPLSFVSCIDEDLSRCGVNYSVDYRLELSASLRQTLDQQLTTPAERQLVAALRSDMTDIMSERAAVMDLSFFTLEDGNLAQHQTVEPDANSLSMTIYMNRGDYHNIALAATHSVSEVTISGASTYTGISLRQAQADTLDSHSAAIYAYGQCFGTFLCALIYGQLSTCAGCKSEQFTGKGTCGVYTPHVVRSALFRQHFCIRQRGRN